MDKLLSIVIPVFNEGEHIKNSISVIRGFLEEIEINHEFVLVDDGSKDDTWMKICEMSENDKDVKGIRFSRNFGKEKALIAGLNEADGDGVLFMDSDLQHPPRYIKEMVKLWESGAEVVEGFKEDRGNESLVYRFVTNSFYRFSEKMTGIKFLNASDFRLLDRKVILALREMTENEPFFRGMSQWVGFKKESFGFKVDDRTEGRSKWSMKALSRLAVNSIISNSDKPLKFNFAVSAIFAMLSLVSFVFVVIALVKNTVTPALICVLILLTVAAILFFNMGIIGLYITKIFNEVNGRPRYIISDKVSANNAGKDTAKNSVKTSEEQ
ncbi:MAG: glycosyltransferase family 2 protein [Lachnospiraceae bacterium]|nr:glycosyltransferase family 2 protein [Lachnospiraceae bacterium]